jgi:hypothetical protein
MGERKPGGAAWEVLAEQRIREAQRAGLFDNLPGLGRPIPGIDQPLEENWWLKRKLRAEGLSVLPPILEVRLEIEKTLEAIGRLSHETAVRRRLAALNEKIRAANASPVTGPLVSVAVLDVEAVVERWRRQRGETGG